MADIFTPEIVDYQPSSSPLLCDETKDLCFDDHLDDVGPAPIFNHHDHHHDGFNAPRSEPFIHHLPPLCEEGFAYMVERESDYLPKQDYLSRLRNGELNLGVRKEAFDWISKAHTYHRFGPLSLCLAVNYLDRFLSFCELPREKDWAVQLVAVACLSIAAKVEETSVPQSIELQVGEPKFMFEGRTIQRMEILVLETLDWKMKAITPCSFLDYSLKKMSDSLSSSSTHVVNRSMHLILCSFKGIEFLEFKASEIAAAVVIVVSSEFQAVDVNNTIISYFNHLDKDKVLMCIEMIQGIANANKRSTKTIDQSPDGVLDNGACFSFKSGDLTPKTRVIGSSCPNTCSHAATTTTTVNSSTHEAKRQRL